MHQFSKTNCPSKKKPKKNPNNDILNVDFTKQLSEFPLLTHTLKLQWPSCGTPAAQPAISREDGSLPFSCPLLIVKHLQQQGPEATARVPPAASSDDQARHGDTPHNKEKLYPMCRKTALLASIYVSL